MTNEEKIKIFDLLNTKKTCRQSFNMCRDEKMVNMYDDQISGIYSVLMLFDLFEEYFNYTYERNKENV